MKKFFAAALAGAVAMSSVVCCVPAAAAALQFSGSVDTNGVLTISGYGNEGYVSVELIRGTEENVVTAYEGRDIGDSILVDAAKVKADGSFTFTYQLSESEKNLSKEERNYTAVIGNSDTYTELKNRTLPLYYAKAIEIESAIDAVEEAIRKQDKTALKKALSDHAAELQISGDLKNEDYLRYTEDAMTILLFAEKETSFADEKAVGTALKKAIALSVMRNASESTFGQMVTRYGDVLGLDMTKYHADATLASAMQKCGPTVIAEQKVTKPDDAAKAFLAVEAVAAVNTALRGDLVETVENYRTIFEIDTTKLSNAQKQKVAGGVCISDAKNAYKTVAAVLSAWTAALNTPSGSGNGNTGYHGTIGGGGGGSSSGIVSGGVVEVEAPENKVPEKQEVFSDLSTVEWAKTYIESLALSGVIDGKGGGVFEPNAPVLREEFMKMLVLAMDLPECETVAEFTDMEADAWYVPYISRALEAGLLKGYDDGRIGIGLPISREEAATLIDRALKTAGVGVSTTAELEYVDAAEISEFAIDAVKACHGAAIMRGDDENRFLPKSSITRAECAKVIYCLMELL